MSNQKPPVYFYLPKSYWQASDQISLMLDKYLNGLIKLSDLWEWHVDTHPGLKSDGLFAWIILPYLCLKSQKFECELVDNIPKKGIVILPRKFIDDDLKPSHECLFVMIKYDGKIHSYSQIHIVQNPQDELIIQKSRLWKNHYIPHYLQPGLLPRDIQHGDRFQNLAYFGLEDNIAPELKTNQWIEKLKFLGYNWSVVNRKKWYDYSNVDAVIAVRSFDSRSYDVKPASKLYNSWQAGVPAILGSESSFQAEKNSELDYIEVTSPEQIIAALETLRNNPDLRQKMVENGKQRSQKTLPDVVTQQWMNFLENKAFPEYYKWLGLPKYGQKLYFLSRDNSEQLKEVNAKFRRIKGTIKNTLKKYLRFL
ncbi:MAG: glycosyltransferase family 4 protein [Sphaerospermopsis sp. SIO1G2]|nr:glycosyltransferase family 4 protein [Sphaerospermopsis sp. SIO1G2]